jgi:hypothetical protein
MTQYTLDLVGLLALLVQVVLPLVVGLVTSMRTHPGAKALLLLALTALTQLLTLWYQNASHHLDFAWKVVLFNIVIGFVISVGSHFGFWRPAGVSARAQAALTGSGPQHRAKS